MVDMEKIMPGYRAFNGYVFSKADADLYNKTCEVRLKYEKNGRKTPERVLDEQYRLFCVIISAV